MQIAPVIAVLAEQIGKRIYALKINLKLNNKQLGDAIGIGPNAVSKIFSGHACQQYAKLAKLAEVLHTDPNDLLGFPSKARLYQEGLQREAFKGAVEGLLIGLGYPPEEAQEYALLAQRVFGTPEAEANHIEAVRAIVSFLIREAVQSKPQ